MFGATEVVGDEGEPLLGEQGLVRKHSECLPRSQSGGAPPWDPLAHGPALGHRGGLGERPGVVPVGRRATAARP